MVRQYRKYIVENRSLIYISTFIVVLLRLIFLVDLDGYYPERSGGFLWNIIFPYFENSRYISFFCSLLFTIGIGLLIVHLNEKYALIRGKTSLPYVITIFLLSFYPSLVFMTPSHIGLIAIIISINILFSAYHVPLASKQACNIGFTIALGSLFIPGLLLYLPVFWLGFFFMRSFSLKVFLSSLLGVAMIYWLFFFFLFAQGNIGQFYDDIVAEWTNVQSFSILQLSLGSLISGAVFLTIIIVAMLSSYVNEFKDKIQVRTSLSFLKIVFLFSILVYFVLTVHPQIGLIVGVTVGGFILSHYFALTNNRWKIYFFIVTVVLYFINYFRLLIE